VALHLNNVPAHIIQIMRRWSSDTFMTYIHSQLLSFAQHLSTYMFNLIPFYNAAAQCTTGHVV
jgi:hypothetical protein